MGNVGGKSQLPLFEAASSYVLARLCLSTRISSIAYKSPVQPLLLEMRLRFAKCSR
jgi:hypothetical protein